MKSILQQITLGAIFYLLLTAGACQKNQATSQHREALSSGQLENVFKPLDGTWKGIFTVYNDPNGQKKGNSRPRVDSKSFLDQLDLKVETAIDVTQVYASDSPTYQRVNITDVYTDGSGNRQEVKSQGYNAVEDGKLICVVNKPDEKVVHDGLAYPDQIIVWGRSESNPTKVEYFFEKVEADTYSIVGWGYYGDDDPKLSPKTWFYGEYKRQK